MTKVTAVVITVIKNIRITVTITEKSNNSNNCHSYSSDYQNRNNK